MWFIFPIVKPPRLSARRGFRNRRLGDFLKELDLTEGRATGLPIVQQALRDNGSPEARFETDDDRTYFLVELTRHPAFAAANSGTNSDTNSGTGLDTTPNLLTEVAKNILHYAAIEPRKRVDILAHLGLTNQSKTYRKLIRPLETAGWLTRTITNKTSSPLQRYQTTPAGLQALAMERVLVAVVIIPGRSVPATPRSSTGRPTAKGFGLAKNGNQLRMVINRVRKRFAGNTSTNRPITWNDSYEVIG